MKSTISSKGQITLPAPIREKLGLVAGTTVRFELRGAGVLVRKGTSGAHPVDQAFGQLRLPKPVDDVIDEMRGPRPVATTRHRRSRRKR